MMIAPTSSGHWDLTLTVVGRPSKRKRSLLSRSADSEEYASVDVMDLDLGARGIAVVVCEAVA